MILIRLLFTIALYFRLAIDFLGITTILGGIRFDMILSGSIAVTTFLPIILLGYFLQKFITTVIKIALYIYALISFVLTEYYCNLYRPLDQVVYAYSFSEIKETIGASLSLNWGILLLFVLHILAALGIIKTISEVKIGFRLLIILGITYLFLAFGFNYKSLIKTEKWYDSHSDFYLAVNQFSYSFISIFEKDSMKTKTILPTEMESIVKEYHQKNPSFTYSSTLYPFERKANDPDVLGPFFSPISSNQLPNFVFILIEGFGRKLTGIDEPTVSFTPFIDSLTANGLFWGNCVSTAERTFGVLPAVFTSAPHGEKGFANIWEPIPDHNSLLKDFHNNGYTTSFFYGGSASFDGQDLFMKANDISYILSAKIDSSQIKQSFLENHRWGLDDAEMFNLAILQKQTQQSSPFVDVYLTLTTHEPFDFDGIDIYKDYVEQECSKCSNVAEKKKILNNKNIFSCFKYLDESVRTLMNYYKSRNDYENTIFIITGDHRMCPLGTSNPLMKYHVPLIIYSPMLKQHHTMNAVVSHYDISPSITSFLRNNYGFRTNEYCHWLGSSFDTAKEFHCSKTQAFMLNNRQVVDYLCDTVLLSDNRLFLVQDNLCVKKIENKNLLEQLQTDLQNYQTLSCYAVQNDYLKHPLVANNVQIEKKFIDFENEKFEIFKKRQKDSTSNYWGEIEENEDYVNLSTLNIKKNYKTVLCEIQFELQSMDTTKDLPILVFSKKGDEAYYVSSEMISLLSKRSLNSGQKENFIFRTTIPNVSDEDSQLKIYLWNKQRGHALYDNLLISVTAYTK